MDYTPISTYMHSLTDLIVVWILNSTLSPTSGNNATYPPPPLHRLTV